MPCLCVSSPLCTGDTIMSPCVPRVCVEVNACVRLRACAPCVCPISCACERHCVIVLICSPHRPRGCVRGAWRGGDSPTGNPAVGVRAATYHSIVQTTVRYIVYSMSIYDNE